MRTMHLYPQPIETRRGWTRRGCRIERRDGGRRVGEEILWFEFTPQPEQLPDHDAEAYLLAAFMAAMREGRTLRAHGAVSTQLLSNLTEFRDAFHCWLPEKYHPVEFDAEARLPAGPPAPGAICAFSGGVDAAFLVWRHTQRLNGHRSQPLQLAIMVHGFDIPLSEARAFERAALRAEKTLSTVRLPLARLRTNYRAALNVQWEYEYMVGLAAALQNFKRRGGAAVVGSSEPYNALAIPWGSSPLTDHLLSSADLLILHDGAALNRT